MTQIDFIDTYSAAHRDVFCENGGFDPIFTTASVEDQETSFGWRKRAIIWSSAPDAQVEHIHDENLGEYFRRKYYIGYWKALLIRWHPERMVQDSHTPGAQARSCCAAATLGLAPVALLGLWLPLLGWAIVPLVGLIIAFLLSGWRAVLGQAGPAFAPAGLGGSVILYTALALEAGYVAGTIHFAGTLPGASHPGWKRIAKRRMDVVGALLDLLLSIPAVASPRSPSSSTRPGRSFSARRVTENGRPVSHSEIAQHGLRRRGNGCPGGGLECAT
ncbi:MAG: hypothetical protein R2851_28345 [Caldilineaceae bacterium]